VLAALRGAATGRRRFEFALIQMGVFVIVLDRVLDRVLGLVLSGVVGG